MGTYRSHEGQFLPLWRSHKPVEGTDEQIGNYKDIHMHRVWWEQDQRRRNSPEKISWRRWCLCWGFGGGWRVWAERAVWGGRGMEGISECVKGNLQVGQYLWMVNVKADKTLWKRGWWSSTLAISVSDLRWLQTNNNSIYNPNESWQQPCGAEC